MEVIPLTLSSSAVHYIFIRQHEAKAGSAIPGDRTLFASNLPVDCTERQLSQFFKAHACGTVEKVLFTGSQHASSSPNENDGSTEEKSGDNDEEMQPVASTSKIVALPAKPPTLRASGHNAHIVFLDASSIPLALALSKSKQSRKYKWPPASAEKDDVPTGLARIMATFDALHPPLSVAREHADTYVEDYEQRVEAAKLAAQQSRYKKGEAIVDEDGFTLVTRGGAYGATLGGGAAVASRKFQLEANSGAMNELEKKKGKKKEKPDFYTFQIREKKRKGATATHPCLIVNC